MTSAALGDLRTTLPFVAGRAALELDQLLLGRPSGFDAVRALADLLAPLVDPLADPATAGVVHKAFIDLGAAGPRIATSADLGRAANELRMSLALIADSATEGDVEAEQIERCRALCNALSRAALARDRAYSEAPLIGVSLWRSSGSGRRAAG